MIDYYDLGYETGKHDLERYGFGSDILASLKSLKIKIPINQWITYARGYSQGANLSEEIKKFEIQRINKYLGRFDIEENPLNRNEKIALYAGAYVVVVGLFYWIFKSKPAVAATNLDTGHFIPATTINPDKTYLVSGVLPAGQNITGLIDALNKMQWSNITFMYHPEDTSEWPAFLPKPNDISNAYVFQGTWHGPVTVIDPTSIKTLLEWIPTK